MLNYLKELTTNKDFLQKAGFLLLLEVCFSIIVWLKKGDINAYLSIFIPQLIILVVLLVFVFYIEGNQYFFFCCCVLLVLGIGIQCIVQEDTESYVVKEVAILVVSVTLAVLSVWAYRKVLPKATIYHIMLGAAGFSLLMYVILIIFGKEHYGTKAWIYIGPISIQLTEFIKISSVLFFSCLFCEGRFSDSRKILFGCIYMIVNLTGSIIIHEMGSFLLLVLIFAVFSILFIDSRKLLAGLCGAVFFAFAAGAGIMTLIYNKGMAIEKAGKEVSGILARIYPVAKNIIRRFNIWMNPFADPLGAGYQGIKAREAMALGGLFGSNYRVPIPVADSDFVFVAILLYLGYFVAALIVVLFVILLVIGIKMYLKNEGEMETGLIAGSIYYLVLQSFIMIFGSTGFFIMTGVPITFISYGGTSTVVAFIMCAIILYVSSDRYSGIYWKNGGITDDQ